ncbi:fimbrial protein [Lelliottia amnigena]|uniref:Fimbrial protein n=1 Tax=Lelliottia amnigena TaxID=61646 RepID=A0ABU7U6G2_LELAM
MNKRLSFILMILFQIITLKAIAGSCVSQTPTEARSLTVPLVIQLPSQSATATTGAVLFKKEASIAQLTGSHNIISNGCVNKLKKILAGRMISGQSGSGIFTTSTDGLGLRVTLIFDKPNHPRREWVLPFQNPISDLTNDSITTDDIKLRFEAIKTSIIKSGTSSVQLPSLLSLNDNSLVVNLALKIMATKSHCVIQMLNPQINLPSINADFIEKERKSKDYPANISLLCLNTKKASINIEGNNSANTPTIFNNLASDNPASGVGIEMLYNGSTLTPGIPIDIILPNQSSFALPLSVRYARLNEKVKEGNIKTQITLRINYL